MKKITCFIVFLIIGIIFSACPSETGNNSKENNNSNNGNNTNNGNNNPIVKTGKVIFVNESGYKVVVHKDAFSGPVLLELSRSGAPQSVDVRISDNYGVGTTFSIEYLYPINNDFDSESGEVIASGIDPNVQINFVIEADKTYTKQIPNPTNLEFRNAFIKIINSHNLPFELAYLGTVFKQTGNGNISVAPGKTGIYKLPLGTEGGISTEGKLYQNYQLTSTFENISIPDFIVKNGFIYSFIYYGSSVTKTGEQTIIFK
jgi:hypothetical protein